MPIYKIYDLDSRGHVAGRPEIVSGKDDSDAIFAANERRKSVDKEIWHERRRVSVVKATDRKPA